MDYNDCYLLTISISLLYTIYICMLIAMYNSFFIYVTHVWIWYLTLKIYISVCSISRLFEGSEQKGVILPISKWQREKMSTIIDFIWIILSVHCLAVYFLTRETTAYIDTLYSHMPPYSIYPIYKMIHILLYNPAYYIQHMISDIYYKT